MKILHSLKGKIVLSTAVIVLLGFLGVGIAVTTNVKNNINDLIIDKAIQEVEQISNQAEILLEMNATNEKIQQFVEDQVKENDYIAYSVVIDTSVTAIAHSDHSKLGRNYSDDDYTVRAASKGETVHSRFFAGVQQAWTIDVMVPIMVNGQLYGAMDVGIYETFIEGTISKMVKTITIYIVLVLVFILIITILICSILFRKFKIIVDKCNQMGEGDFSVPMDAKLLKRKDEIGIIANALNRMRENVGDLMKKTMQQADSIVEIAEKVNNKSESTASLSQDIRTSLDSVVEGSGHQEELTDETTRLMEQINEGMEEVANNMQKVSDASTSTVTNAHNGYELVNTVTEQMNQIQQRVQETADKIVVLSNKSNEIQQVVEFITDIASQTNLLSLNASIEAARAGEQGRGFAVVAEQVGQLAVQSSKAASEIVELVKEIQNETKNSMESMNDSRDAIEHGIVMAQNAGVSFKDILSQITSMSEEFTNISAITEEVTASTNNLLTSVENISEITKDNSSNTTQVFERMGSQNEYLSDISQAAKELDDMSHKLNDAMKVFKI